MLGVLNILYIIYYGNDYLAFRMYLNSYSRYFIKNCFEKASCSDNMLEILEYLPLLLIVALNDYL